MEKRTKTEVSQVVGICLLPSLRILYIRMRLCSKPITTQVSVG